jgi:hypothetical protein
MPLTLLSCLERQQTEWRTEKSKTEQWKLLNHLERETKTEKSKVLSYLKKQQTEQRIERQQNEWRTEESNLTNHSEG